MISLARFLARHRVGMAVTEVLAYLLVLLPVSVILFPDSNIWLALLILVMGALEAMKDLGDRVADEVDA